MIWLRADPEISKNKLLQKQSILLHGAAAFAGILPKQLPGVLQVPSQLLGMIFGSQRFGSGLPERLLLALGHYLNCSQHRHGHWRGREEALAAERSLWGRPRFGWHLPSLLVCQTCQHAGHAAKGTGGLLWDVINKFVGLVGRPLLEFICVHGLYAADRMNLVRGFFCCTLFLHF